MQKDNVWLDEVAETCTMTLGVLQKKAEERGRLSHADQTMTDLCLGYLYLLSICDKNRFFEDDSIMGLTDIIKSKTTIH
tara:strand:+ start:651 stop:887 length:237 start_codon:yes stop_codon:yes gene_type:complete